MQKDKGATEQRKDEFKLGKNDLDDIYLKKQRLPDSLWDDMTEWNYNKNFRSFWVRQVYSWMLENKQQKLLKTAKIAHQVIDNLLIEKVPHLFIEVYFQVLISKKSLIQKIIQFKEAQKVFKYIPNTFVIDYLELFQIPLTTKQKMNIIDELIDKKQTTNDKLAKLPKLFHQKENEYKYEIMDKLMIIKRYDVAAKILKKLHISKQKYPNLHIKLMETAARGMPRWEKDKYCWERLEEVFMYYPTALAACINEELSDRRHISHHTLEGYASICKRIPEVYKHLQKKNQHKLKKIQIQIPNKMRSNVFGPSNKNEYFSIIDFGIEEKDVIWVNGDNVYKCIEQMCKAPLIGIDTQSTVARSTLSTNKQLLATIQISTQKQIFVFDAKQISKLKIKSKDIDAFFSNPNVTIIGHTLGSDLNGDVTQIFGFKDKVKCFCIELVPIFKKLYPKNKPGLTSISEVILGKPICKQYTLTNWDRRPLFKNQLHYAALDALIVIKIWQVLKLKVDIQKLKKQATEQKKRPLEKKEDAIPETQEQTQEQEVTHEEATQ